MRERAKCPFLQPFAFSKKEGTINESKYQAKLMKKLRELFPGCVIIRNDPNFIQGIPDLLILFKNKWAMLEIKRASDSTVQPNQLYYVETFHEMSFASFISPETEEDVLHDLQQAFGHIGETCVP